jgi:hypothetical protein
VICGCIIHENDEPRLYRGHPEFRAILVPASKVRIVDVWDTTGMRGTCSDDMVVDDDVVPLEDSTTMLEAPHCRRPLYAFPPVIPGVARGSSVRNRTRGLPLR